MKSVLVSICLVGSLFACGACTSLDGGAPVRWSDAASRNYVVVTVRNPIVPLPQRAGSSPRNYDVGGDYGPGPRARSDVRALAKIYDIRPVSAWPIALLDVHCLVFETPANADVGALVERMRVDRRVESVQPLNSFAVSAAPYSDTYANLQRNIATLHLPQAHRYVRGAGVRVAVVDTGIDASHPDMQGRVIEQRNLVGDQLNATNERHGTAVAGIIVAVDNNKQGIVGVAPEAQLLALRACWPATPNDAQAMCNTFTLAQALSAAVDLRADVVNLSLSGPSDPLLSRLIQSGMSRGIVYVGAASPMRDTFPGNVGGVLRVVSNAASNTGGDSHALHAPGVDVVTLTPQGGYDFLSGTSLAAASVSGGVALLLSHRPKVDRHKIPAALLSSQSNGETGVDVCAALAILDSKVICERE